MTRLDAVLAVLQSTIATVDALDPADQDVVYRALLDHVRARRPESVGYLSQLPEPTEEPRDPRKVNLDDDLPWPSDEEMAEINHRNIVDARREREGK